MPSWKRDSTADQEKTDNEATQPFELHLSSVHLLNAEKYWVGKNNVSTSGRSHIKLFASRLSLGRWISLIAKDRLPFAKDSVKAQYSVVVSVHVFIYVFFL